MISKKKIAVLLSLLVIMAMPGSAFASDTVNQSATQPNAPVDLMVPLVDGEETPVSESDSTVPQTIVPEQQTLDASVPEETAIPEEGNTPEEVTESAIEPPEPVAEEQPAVDAQPEEVIPQETTESAIEPQVPADEEQPAVEEQPADEEQPAAEEPPVVEEQPEEPATSETPIAEPEVPVPAEEVPVTEPAITVEEVVTEPAIVVEPEAATLTITHRLIVGDFYSDELQVIDGLEVGQKIDLTEYLVAADLVECITQEMTISLDQPENAVLLEYVVKADVEVDNSIENEIEAAGNEDTDDIAR